MGMDEGEREGVEAGKRKRSEGVRVGGGRGEKIVI